MDKPDKERLTQDSDQMFERNIAVLAARQREVKVSSPVGVVIGFLSGLDESSVQICRSDNQKFVLFSRQGPLLIEETGKTLRGLRKEEVKDENNENIADVIEMKVKKFSNKAQTIAPRKGVVRGVTASGIRTEREEVQ